MGIMKNDVILSVVVPIFNVEKYLQQCVLSLVNQSIKGIEIILVDDGSTDGCPKICDRFAKTYDNITVIHKQNGGLSDARNVGIQVAKGEWIAFVDSDDYVLPEMFETLYRLVTNYHVKLAMVDYQMVDENGCNIEEECDPSFLNGLIEEKQIYQKLLTESAGHYIVAWNKLYHRSLWKNRTFPVGKINEDQFVMHEIFLESKQVACTSERLYCYRKVSNSIMNRRFSVRRLDDVEGLHCRFHFYEEHELLERLYRTECMAFNKLKVGMKKLPLCVQNRERISELLMQQKVCYYCVKKNSIYKFRDKLERILAFYALIPYWRFVRRKKNGCTK